MSKNIDWSNGYVHKVPRAAGEYASFREKMEKAHDVLDEQRRAQEYLAKASFPMAKLLEIRMSKGEPLIVMRPLMYQTSGFAEEEEDDGFYVKKSEQVNPKFVDITVTIHPGTQLVLKSLNPSLQQFVFEDAMGKEHEISYTQKDLLMTQTDIFETVQKYFETQGEM